MKPGLYDDIPELEYHAHPTSLSVSGAKVLLDSPARYAWQRQHPVVKDVFDFGHAVHAKVLGTGLDVVVVQKTNKDSTTEDATDYRSDSAKEHRDAIRAEGGVPLLRDDVDKADAMAKEVRNHPTAAALLADGRPEVSMFATDEATQVLRRGRVDWLRDDLVVDYKTTVNADPRDFARSAANFGYHMQHAMYVDLLNDLGHDARSLVFIAQEKEPPFLVSVTELVPSAVDVGRERNHAALRIFRDCTEAGIWPAYPNEVTPIDLPDWAYREGVPA